MPRKNKNSRRIIHRKKRPFPLNVKPGKQVKQRKTTHVHYQIPLSDEDRVSYVFAYDKSTILKDGYEITEVINVSQEFMINDEWITVVRFDSEHGYLHKHVNLTPSDLKGTESTLGVKNKATKEDG